VDTYLFETPDDDIVKILSSRMDLFFTVAFAFESVFKAIAYGFIFDKGSYLRETWS